MEFTPAEDITLVEFVLANENKDDRVFMEAQRLESLSHFTVLELYLRYYEHLFPLITGQQPKKVAVLHTALREKKVSEVISEVIHEKESAVCLKPTDEGFMDHEEDIDLVKFVLENSSNFKEHEIFCKARELIPALAKKTALDLYLRYYEYLFPLITGQKPKDRIELHPALRETGSNERLTSSRSKFTPKQDEALVKFVVERDAEYPSDVVFIRAQQMESSLSEFTVLDLYLRYYEHLFPLITGKSPKKAFKLHSALQNNQPKNPRKCEKDAADESNPPSNPTAPHFLNTEQDKVLIEFVLNHTLEYGREKVFVKAQALEPLLSKTTVLELYLRYHEYLFPMVTGQKSDRKEELHPSLRKDKMKKELESKWKFMVEEIKLENRNAILKLQKQMESHLQELEEYSKQLNSNKLDNIIYNQRADLDKNVRLIQDRDQEKTNAIFERMFSLDLGIKKIPSGCGTCGFSSTLGNDEESRFCDHSLKFSEKSGTQKKSAGKFGSSNHQQLSY
ncbi:hypothetical protein GCK72_019650 [Caenorhabditis remanei]|uniref:Uncharacterized protein n=1 Tax=Caenorhabditis remanei TaxID=31234 RepID=A0A6A5GEC8_CAERE|nr:hypothetical protein GCK72_019650 [Caenorhabditis remanei]KAF1753094.1 hypothetical protein GCK72_019650 [Caenorhabditis remanei]